MTSASQTLLGRPEPDDIDALCAKVAALPPERKAQIRDEMAALDRKRDAEAARDALALRWRRLLAAVEQRRVGLTGLDAAVSNVAGLYRSVAEHDRVISDVARELKVEALPPNNALTPAFVAAAVSKACRGDQPTILRADILLDLEEMSRGQIAAADRAVADAFVEVGRLSGRGDAQ